MDNVNHIITILNIGLNSPLERSLQTTGIQNIRHLLRMSDDLLGMMEYMKGDVPLPVPDYQIASLRLFIEFYKTLLWTTNCSQKKILINLT